MTIKSSISLSMSQSFPLHRLFIACLDYLLVHLLVWSVVLIFRRCFLVSLQHCWNNHGINDPAS
uniref:Uncharacterized protein n=1 Tax=Utricularia reniformis TaxID=192314 RepID=A0A1Y0AZJ3_9LAMI|nr:hypothetical protein AEK19_MT0284 [Utricularia reniformis]ART30560.1 hypothetical protein AEK19_MT0284 [Utricularia reniformis]